MKPGQAGHRRGERRPAAGCESATVEREDDPPDAEPGHRGPEASDAATESPSRRFEDGRAGAGRRRAARSSAARQLATGGSSATGGSATEASATEGSAVEGSAVEGSAAEGSAAW